MYKNTLPLLKQNIKLFSSIVFVSVFSSDIEEVTKYKTPKWVTDNDLTKYLKG